MLFVCSFFHYISLSTFISYIILMYTHTHTHTQTQHFLYEEKISLFHILLINEYYIYIYYNWTKKIKFQKTKENEFISIALVNRASGVTGSSIFASSQWLHVASPYIQTIEYSVSMLCRAIKDIRKFSCLQMKIKMPQIREEICDNIYVNTQNTYHDTIVGNNGVKITWVSVNHETPVTMPTNEPTHTWFTEWYCK